MISRPGITTYPSNPAPTKIATIMTSFSIAFTSRSGNPRSSRPHLWFGRRRCQRSALHSPWMLTSGKRKGNRKESKMLEDRGSSHAPVLRAIALRIFSSSGLKDPRKSKMPCSHFLHSLRSGRKCLAAIFFTPSGRFPFTPAPAPRPPRPRPWCGWHPPGRT
jgi:hypothetical protein